ncbi:hypothetical protein [Sphingomonas paucimobilis]|uniref:hypothetical protein n=1 Tax=Sphingomonas paucimobilis TaxID=13689 RepID=UPI00069FE5CD|nr:hypothetical protein [Sphingomonas paucimobilis]
MDVVTADGGRFSLGTVEAGATVGIIDFSRRVTDDFGVTTVVQRGFSRRLSVRLAVPSEDADGLQRRLADLRSTAARWIADDRFAWLSPSGFYKDFDIDLAVPPLSFCTLTVEGLAETEVGPDAGGDPAPNGESTLRLLQPFPVTDAALLASSVAENDAPAWAAGTGYVVGAKVLRQHRVYEAVIANTGKDPAAGGAEWLDTGPSNRWSMFDQALGTVTAAQGEIAVTIEIAAMQAVALLDVTGATVRVTADGYDRTQAVTGGAVTFLDLGAKGRVTIQIAGAGSVSVGTVLVGKLVALGLTEASPTAGITDFSRKDVDDFGEVTIVKRGWAKRMTAKALIRTDALDLVANRIAAVRAVPSLWIGQDGRDSLTIYGFFKDFGITVDGPLSKLSLSIEGLSAAAPIAALVEWEAVGNTGGKKPSDNADKTSENVARDTAFVGGTPSKTVNDQLARIEPITSNVSAIALAQAGHAAELAVLADARIDMEAVQRQAERAAGRLDETLLRLLSESSRTREVLRDAGIVVDPVTGVVRIYAVDQVAERTNRVEVGLDAVRGTVSLKADSNWVEERIALAVLDPAQAAQLEPIIKRLVKAEVEVDGLKGTVTSKADAIELTKVGGRVTTVEQDIDALKGSIALKLDRTTFDGLKATVQSIEQKLDTVGDTTSYSLNVRQARLVADDAATAALRGLLAGDEANQRQIVQAAQARQDIFTRLDGDKLTEAQARLALTAEIGAVRSMAVSETTARITAVDAVARDVRALGVTTDKQAAAIGEVNEAVIDAKGGLARSATTIRQVVGRADTADEAILRALINGDDASRARQAQIVQIQTEFSTTLNANESASAFARQALLARMNAAEAAIVDVQRVLTDNIQSLVERVRASEAAWRDPETGLVATRARLALEENLSTTRFQANAKAIETLSSTVNDPNTGLPAAFATIGTVRETAANENAATAKRVDQVRAVIDGVGSVGLQQAFEAVVDRLGKIEGTITFKIDNNGNVTGLQLIGPGQGPGSLNLINTDLRLGTGRVIYNDGNVMWVHGVGFGVARDLLEWFGPTMAIENCSRANAKSYKSTDGSEFMGGALSISTLTHPGGSASLAADAVAEVSSFGSNGKPVKYIASWTYYQQWTAQYAATNDGLKAFNAVVESFNATSDDGGYTYFGSKSVEQPASTITLTRTFGATADQLQQKSFTSQQQTFFGLKPVVGAGESGKATFTTSIGGGFTVTDPVQSTANRTLRLALSRGFTLHEGVVQRLTIVAVEE